MSNKYKNNCVYKVTNKTTKKSYIGKHSGDLDPSEDVGVNYFTSSSDLEFYNDFVNNTNNYNIKILGNYSSSKEAINKEIELHEKYNVGVNPLYYNRSKSTSTGFDITGYKHTEETKRKIGNSRKNYKHSEETKRKISENMGDLGGSNNPMYGKKHSEETIQLMSKSKSGYNNPNYGKRGEETAMYGKKHTEETKKRMSISNSGSNHPAYGKRGEETAMYGKKHTEETKNNIREKLSGRCHSKESIDKMIEAQSKIPISNCIHCGATMKLTHLNRYHNENCKEVYRV